MTQKESTRTAAWGKVRDALAAVHNLETLLRSPRVGAGVLAGLLPELLVSCVVLRAAFDTRADGVCVDLTVFARERLDALEQAMKEASTTGIEARARLALEQVVERVSGDLDAAVDLLELSERARAATRTELSLGELTRAALGIGGSVSGILFGDDVHVRIDTQEAACVLICDPHVVSRLLSAAIARVRSAGVRDITVWARCEPREVTLTVAASDARSIGTQPVTTRVKGRIPPTDAVVEDAARAIGGRLVGGDRSVVLWLPTGVEEADEAP
jgi:hypothetical protein